jgi:alkylhydroperoxidase/carboxymuconolactone decarboxylase family protein YurZ
MLSACSSEEANEVLQASPKATPERGATREEIAEVLGVAVSVNAGAAVVYSSRALDAFEAAAEIKPTPKERLMIGHFFPALS